MQPQAGRDSLYAAPGLRKQQDGRPARHTRVARPLQTTQFLDMLAVVKRAHSESSHTPSMLALPFSDKGLYP
jgi:hypothetical protein